MKLDNVIAVRNNKIIYRDGDKCIKVFNEGYSKSAVFNEALNQSALEDTELNIPEILEVTMIDGKWAIVSEFIEGKTLAQLIEENPDKKDEYLELFVNLQIKMQAQKSHLLRRLKDRMTRKICETELVATTRYDLHSRVEDMPNHTKICHGDFNPSNIIISDDGKPYIVDHSHTTQGNASADAARTYLFFRFNDDIDGANKYLDLFCDKTGTLKQYVQKWIPIVAAALSGDSDSEEKALMLSCINAADFK